VVRAATLELLLLLKLLSQLSQLSLKWKQLLRERRVFRRRAFPRKVFGSPRRVIYKFSSFPGLAASLFSIVVVFLADPRWRAAFAIGAAKTSESDARSPLVKSQFLLLPFGVVVGVVVDVFYGAACVTAFPGEKIRDYQDPDVALHHHGIC